MRPRLAVAVLVAAWLAANAPALGKSLAAEQILRKGETIRNPDLDYAVDFTIHGVSRGKPAVERDASYSMIASGKDRTVIVMRSPTALYGALVLMADDRYWMLLPQASRPWELSGAQMQNGDVATGDIARANLTRGYKATISGADELEGESCWRLELVSDGGSAHYSRILYWVAKNGFFPRQLEHYGLNGKLIKTVRYFDYRKGALGLRSMRLTIDSVGEWKETSTLSFANLRKIGARRAPFTPDELIGLRDAALAARKAAGASDVSLEHILGMMD